MVESGLLPAMPDIKTSNNSESGKPGSTSPLLWFAIAGFGVVLILGLMFRLLGTADEPGAQNSGKRAGAPSSSTAGGNGRDGPGSRPGKRDGPPAEEIVAKKLSEFASHRRDLVRRMAEKFKTEIPPGYERFFELAQAGDWEAVHKLYQQLEKEPREDKQRLMWQAVRETHGIMEDARNWPAQRLLDYGTAVLNSLKPDMVYVGGTDPGRFIPTLMNETGSGPSHIVLTQNALADGTYLEYVNFLYDGQLNGLSGDDSQRSFQTYVADAQRRLQHDTDFPDEPKQLRRGEDIQVTDGRVQVSGQVAVMLINESLLNTLMQKNPNLSFALEESFPLVSTYANATPLGPIMELGSANGSSALTADTAAQSLDYWRSAAQQLTADTTLGDDSETRREWAKMAASQGNLFANRGLSGEAEQAYQIAAGLAPNMPEPVNGLAELLARSGRLTEANQLLDNYSTRNPTQAAATARERQYLTTLPAK